MDRAKATQQLERIVAAAEAGDFPVQVTALYVFGSFARGALKPGDLDLVVVYEPPPAESPIHRTGKCMQRDRDGLYHRRLSEDELTTMMREVMCQPGEAIDTVFVTSFDEIRLSSRWEKIADSKFVLVWSKTSRDWRANLAAIKPNEAAGRWNRSRFTGASLFRCDITTMDQVGDALRQNVLAVTCISAQEITLNFNTEDQQWLDGLIEIKCMGPQSLKLLPYGMWWMRQQESMQRVKPVPVGRAAALVSPDGKYIAYFGQPLLRRVFDLADKDNPRTRVCLIPRFRRNTENELFVFERGPLFSEAKLETIIRQHLLGHPKTAT